MKAENWYGYYWARRTENGGYEICILPSTLEEHSVPGGVFPKEGLAPRNASRGGLRR
jgi:hypothetical protein